MNLQVTSTCEAHKTLEWLQESKMRYWKKGEMARGRCGRRDLVYVYSCTYTDMLYRLYTVYICIFHLSTVHICIFPLKLQQESNFHLFIVRGLLVYWYVVSRTFTNIGENQLRPMRWKPCAMMDLSSGSLSGSGTLW